MTFRGRGTSDSGDGTNIFPGAMAALTNLIPAPQTQDQWVPRPASTLDTSFAGFTGPGNLEGLFPSGVRIYGWVQQSGGAGHSVPFIWDTQASAFVTITGVLSANTPVPTSNSGEWIPPTIAQIGDYVVFTHPGFTLPNAFGWLDMTGFSSSTITGNTHTSTLVDNLSTNVLQAGWRPGMTITDAVPDIPAGTRIVSVASNGLSLTLSAAATGSNATTFTVAGGTFAAPLWSVGNLNEHPLPAVATAVTLYAGSAIYAVNTTSPPSAAIVFSDAGDPLRRTDAAAVQVITYQSTLPVTALAAAPLSTLTGGFVNALFVFQGPSAIQQVLGTPLITGTLSTTALNDSIGTSAPNTISLTPKGLLFAAPDGVRMINQQGSITPVIGRRGGGVSIPILFAVTPSRMCGAYNESVYRISMTNGAAVGAPVQEYWYHEEDNCWTGPHTFPASLIIATQAPHSFAMAAAGIAAKLWQSDAYATLAATYVENSVQMTFLWKTTLMPDTLAMSENGNIQAAVMIAIPAQQVVEVTFTNELTAVLGQYELEGSPTPPALWGTAVWGTAIWGAGTAYLRQRHINWPAPIVFKQGQVALAGNCLGGLILGNLYLRYSELGYLLLTETA